MLRSWKLGTAFGIGVYVHWSFLLLLALVMVVNRGGGIGSAVFAGVLLVAVFCCVVLHEFGHALMARRFGIGTRDITLYPIGGVARLERMSERPSEEMLIALAGPAVNVAIASVILILLVILGLGAFREQRLEEVLQPGASLLGIIVPFLGWLLGINAMLALFNLLPVFPMDGGRVLRALLATQLGYLRATEVAAAIGMVMAGLFIVYGMVSMVAPGASWSNPFFALLGMFVFLVGQQELAQVRQRARLREQGPLDVTLAEQEPIDVLPASQFLDTSAVPAEPNFSGFTWDRRARVWIEWRNGQPVHVCRSTW